MVSKQAIENKEKIVVGLNEFAEEEEAIETLKIGAKIEERQIKEVKGIRKKRNKKKWKASLEKLKGAAEGKENLMPYIIDAVKAYATVGEVSDTLKEVFGEYKEPAIF